MCDTNYYQAYLSSLPRPSQGHQLRLRIPTLIDCKLHQLLLVDSNNQMGLEVFLNQRFCRRGLNGQNLVTSGGNLILSYAIGSKCIQGSRWKLQCANKSAIAFLSPCCHSLLRNSGASRSPLLDLGFTHLASLALLANRSWICNGHGRTVHESPHL